MIISVDFLEFHPISVMFSGYSNPTSMGMQLRAENRDSIDRKALECDKNMYVLNEYNQFIAFIVLCMTNINTGSSLEVLDTPQFALCKHLTHVNVVFKVGSM